MTGSTLTLQNSSGPATVTVDSGSHVINDPVVLGSPLVVSGSGTLTFGSSGSSTSTITGPYGLTMSGAGGKLVLGGTDSYTGPTTVTAGKLYVTSSTALPDEPLVVAAGGTFIFDPSASFGTVVGSNNSSSAAAVPEPGTLALLLAAMVLGGGFAWRRRKG